MPAGVDGDAVVDVVEHSQRPQQARPAEIAYASVQKYRILTYQLGPVYSRASSDSCSSLLHSCIVSSCLYRSEDEVYGKGREREGVEAKM